jgi:hypothetical protein
MFDAAGPISGIVEGVGFQMPSFNKCQISDVCKIASCIPLFYISVKLSANMFS